MPLAPAPMAPPIPCQRPRPPSAAPAACHTSPYRGRFAPSPTGPLHAGSLVTALASWLDARVHRGQWLVRIEDIDLTRCRPAHSHAILRQLHAHGLHPDAPPLYQSQRQHLYHSSLQHIIQQRLAYRCTCTRRQIQQAQPATDPSAPPSPQIYPGTCRHLPPEATAHATHYAWRLNVHAALHSLHLPDPLTWHDRRLGAQQQSIAHAVGDFVLKRADAIWAYQLAVVVDDCAQGITHIVRGEDLLENTPRQILLQHLLGGATPDYLHVPLVYAANGQKLSKQNGAQALPDAHGNEATGLMNLQHAARALHLPPAPCRTIDAALQHWLPAWQHMHANFC